MLRKVVLGAVSGIALASSAFAADIYSPSGVNYAPPPLVPVSTWAGFYIGANGGYGGQSGLGYRDQLLTTAAPGTIASMAGTTTIAGGFGGGQAGYNFQYGNYVFGIETDIQGSDIQGSGNTSSIAAGPTALVPLIGRFATADARVDYFGTVRGRLGYSIGGVLLYATGGFAYGGVKETLNLSSSTATVATTSSFVSNNNTDTGWTVGGGIEYKISPSWSIKGEYQYIDLSSNNNNNNAYVTTGVTPCTTAGACYHNGNVKNIDFNTVRVGVNYYFNTPYQPLPMK